MQAGAPLRLVVFDCDGTLVDSQHTIAAAMAAAFAASGLPAPPVEAVRRVVGLSLDEAIGRLLHEAQRGAIDRLVDDYKQAFFALRSRTDVDHDPLFPGAREVLDALDAAGILAGIATGKSRRGLEAVLDGHGLAGRFVTLQTADRHPGKPHPAMVQAAMAEAGAASVDTVLVGDTSYDIEMAGNAGITAVGVTWGYHPPAELTAMGAAHIISEFSELLDILEI